MNPASSPVAPAPSGVPYSVRLPAFEGPLELLLSLIRAHKLDICAVSITAVTDQYLAHLALMQALDLDVAGEFLVVAATLMEIKSRALLPRPDLPADAEDEVDPRAELVARLMEYERYQQLAERLRDQLAAHQLGFSRGGVDEWDGPVPLRELSPQDLLAALRSMSQDDESTQAAPVKALRVRREAIQIRQAADTILGFVLRATDPLPFSRLLLLGHVRDRRTVLVYFLAILELIRVGEVRAWQKGLRGEILVGPPAEPAAAA